MSVLITTQLNHSFHYLTHNTAFMSGNFYTYLTLTAAGTRQNYSSIKIGR